MRGVNILVIGARALERAQESARPLLHLRAQMHGSRRSVPSTKLRCYRSVVKGPPERVGDFALEALDRERGYARVRSSTPFPRAMERGVLAGGMRGPGDLAYVEVTNPTAPPFRGRG